MYCGSVVGVLELYMVVWGCGCVGVLCGNAVGVVALYVAVWWVWLCCVIE